MEDEIDLNELADLIAGAALEVILREEDETVEEVLNNDKDKDVEKEVKKSETLPPQSPPQYSERLSDISSIRTATTMRSDRETLKVSKITFAPRNPLVSELFQNP